MKLPTLSFNQLKSVLSQVLYKTGCLNSVLRRRVRNHAFVLMYHRVIPEKEIASSTIQPGMYVKNDTFERHLIFLKKHFSVLHLSDLIRSYSAGRDISGCCSITFDDGWYDNYLYAFPLLRKYSVPASVFLATGYIGSHEVFWADLVAAYLYGIRNESNRIKYVEALTGVTITAMGSRSQDSWVTITDKSICFLKELSEAKRAVILEKLKAALPEFTNDTRLYMNWDEVREMQKSGQVTFGAHTVNHVLLDRANYAEMRKEIEESRAHIFSRTGADATLFAYPNGNYNPMTLDILRNNGFIGAVTTRRGYIGWNTSPYEVPRIGMHDDVSSSEHRFMARIAMPLF